MIVVMLMLAGWIGLGSPAIARALPTDAPTALGIDPMLSEDAISLPPTRQVILSPQETYILLLQAPVDWQSKQVTATLFEATSDRCQPVWSQTLPHEYGPRYALVNDRGQVVLLDEWINVASPYAITVISPTGDTVAQYSFDQVAAVLAVSRADLVDQAATGWWISAPPTLSRDGDTVRVAAGSDRLEINLATGALSP